MSIENVNDSADSAAFQASELDRVGKLFSWRLGKSSKKKREEQKEIERGERTEERNKQSENFLASREARNQMVMERTEKLMQGASRLHPGDSQGVDKSEHRSSKSSSRSQPRSRTKAPGEDEEESRMNAEIEGNLHFMGKHLQHLRAMSVTMNQDIEGQSRMMEQMSIRSHDASTKIGAVDARLKKRG